MKYNFRELSDKYIAQGCTTYSKRYDQFIEGLYPTHVHPYVRNKKDDNSIFTCSNSDDYNLIATKSYIDLGGLGSNLFYKENNFSLPSFKECLFAEMLVKMVDIENFQKIKIYKTGSQACEMAVRFARAFKNESMIWFSGYHGTHDTFISHEIPGAGTIGKEHSRKFDTLNELIVALKDIDYDQTHLKYIKKPAMVMIEPVILDDTIVNRVLVHEIIKLCKKNDILTCFDEIVSGFRYKGYTYSKSIGANPDLICLGKGLGEGHPLSVLGGIADIMDNPAVFSSNTCNGEEKALSVAGCVLEKLKTFDYDTFKKNGDDFIEELNIAFIGHGLDIKIKGTHCRCTIIGDETQTAQFWKGMLSRGYLMGKSIFFSLSWERTDYTRLICECLMVIQELDKYKLTENEKLPRPVFKRY